MFFHKSNFIIPVIFSTLLTSCGGSSSSGTDTSTTTPTTNTTSYTVSAAAGAGGSISPGSASVVSGASTNFTVTADAGYNVGGVSGCGGSLSGNTYTIGTVTAACTVTASFVISPPVTAATPAMILKPVKTFRFTWSDVSDATYYKLLENPDGVSGFTQVGSDVSTGVQSFDHIVPLYARVNAKYILQSCNFGGCTDSAPVSVTGTLEASVGYFKASNTETNDVFGKVVVLSADGNTLAVSATSEDSSATAIDGDASDNATSNSGAVYVFIRNGSTWAQQAYIKASNTGAGDFFGTSLGLSANGNILAVGAYGESSNAIGVDGNALDNGRSFSGAVYMFARSDTSWSQQAYIKASNTGLYDSFGSSLSLSSDGGTLAVGARIESSNAIGVGGDQADDTASAAGAVYVFTFSAGTGWSQQAYIKASNTDADDRFGGGVSLSANGNTLAVAAIREDSNASNVNGGQTDNSLADAGAVYVYTRNAGSWSQQAYIKASNPGANDAFGMALSLSADGNILAVGANLEGSNATGVGGDQSDNSASEAGAVYVYTRNNTTWSHQAYIKASNAESGDRFGSSLALNADGSRLIVGGDYEQSNAIGVGGDQLNNNADASGAVYVFTLSGSNWSQMSYIKSSNTAVGGDTFGVALSLSADGNILAVGADSEDSNATGVGGDQADNSTDGAGAVYLY